MRVYLVESGWIFTTQYLVEGSRPLHAKLTENFVVNFSMALRVQLRFAEDEFSSLTDRVYSPLRGGYIDFGGENFKAVVKP